MEKTIAAISTPMGTGAISIVRLSGEQSFKIASLLFNTTEKIEHRKMCLGNFDDGFIHEKCLMVYFKAPNSYTGEDIVEFQIHGGEMLTQKILSSLLSKGAVLAEAGEFTKRAFLNGKINLAEADNISRIIHASSEAELKIAMGQSTDNLTKTVKEIQEKIKNCLAEIDVNFDYPEHDDETMAKEDMLTLLTEIKFTMEKLYNENRNSKFIRTGINVAIVGKPNVGKSSLLNAILGNDRAIVTDIAGTTRDNLVESTFFGGLKLNLIDTAGIHESQDYVENLGIQRSINAINTSDIVMAIFDGANETTEEDKKILEDIKNKNYIIVINKSDMPKKLDIVGDVEISAKNGQNINELLKTIVDKVMQGEVDYNATLILNERNLECVKNALTLISEIEAIKHESLDILEIVLKKLYFELGRITGNTENDEIIDLIFSKFCLGK